MSSQVVKAHVNLFPGEARMAEKVSISPILKIDEVEIYPVRPRGGLVAFASCVINGSLYLGNMAIHTRADGRGYRLVFPDKTLPNGKLIQCVHPVTREAGELLLQAIVSKFEGLISSIQSGEDVASMARQSGGYNGNSARVS
jgi:DNA-binding cell septation regulator SpoVG